MTTNAWNEAMACDEQFLMYRCYLPETKRKKTFVSKTIIYTYYMNKQNK